MRQSVSLYKSPLLINGCAIAMSEMAIEMAVRQSDEPYLDKSLSYPQKTTY